MEIYAEGSRLHFPLFCGKVGNSSAPGLKVESVGATQSGPKVHVLVFHSRAIRFYARIAAGRSSQWSAKGRTAI